MTDPAIRTRRLGEARLKLVPANKVLDSTPDGITFGNVVFRGWQIHRISPLPSDFDGRAAYLVRAHYEFAFEPGTESPLWVEAGFTFPEQNYAVVDALPRRVAAAVAEAGYTLDASLNFSRRSAGEGPGRPASAPTVDLPAMTPVIDCLSGPGASRALWRHSGDVRPGVHTAYFVLSTALDRLHLDVVAQAAFAVELDPVLGLRPFTSSDSFTLTLPGGATAERTAVDTDAQHRPAGPRVFISYAWETPEHQAAVARLCALLVDAGIDARMDIDGPPERRNWELWTSSEIINADFILIIASPAYRAVGNNEVAFDENPGLQSEFSRIADLLHSDRAGYTKRILPIILPGRSNSEIPLTFLPRIGSYYTVKELTLDGTKSVIETITRSSGSS